MFWQYSLLLSFVVVATKDVISENDFKEGERYYGDLLQKTESYGDCWKTAVSDLRLGCKRLTEEVQGRLALAFSNCFLLHAGLEPCHCDRDSPLSDCLKGCEYRVLSTYTEFFTYTTSICHYLENRWWQEEASKTVLELTRNSQLVSRKLNESFKSQSRIVELQQSALKEQMKLISSGKTLKVELQQSREKARDMYMEFKTTTDEQKFLLFQVFDRVKNLQNFVLGEFTTAYTVAYYFVVAILIYVLTSVPQTAGARIWLILAISLSAISERILTTSTLHEEFLETNHHNINGLLYSRIWLCRKVICSICLVILLFTYYHYKDYNVINNQLLKEILQQNKELQNFIKGLNIREDIHNASRCINSQGHPSMILESIIVANGRITAKTPDIYTKVVDQSGSEKQLSQRKIVYKKKSTSSQQGTPITSPAAPAEESTSPQSPASQRYNLRRSSGLNSPQ